MLVYDKTGSAALTGLLVTVSVLPWIGIGQVLATLGDRFPRKQLMIVCDLIRALVFVVMLVPMPIWLLFVLAFVAALPTPPFDSAKSALLPETVPRYQYPDALALATIVAQGTTVLGYLLGGVLVALASARGALLVNALSFLVSALVLTQLRVGETSTAKSKRMTLGAGARAIYDDVMVRRAVAFFASVNIGAIVPQSLAAGYALKQLAAGDTAAGVLYAAVPLGMIVTVSVVPLEDHSPRWLLKAAGVLATCGAAAALVLFGLNLDLPLIVFAFIAVGVTLGSAIPTNTVAGSRLPNESRASAFGLINGILLAADAGGAAIGALVAALLDVRAACIIAMGMVLAVGLIGILTAPHEPVKQMTPARMPPAPPPAPSAVADSDNGLTVHVVPGAERQPPAPPPRPVQTA